MWVYIAQAYQRCLVPVKPSPSQNSELHIYVWVNSVDQAKKDHRGAYTSHCSGYLEMSKCRELEKTGHVSRGQVDEGFSEYEILDVLTRLDSQ